MGKMAKTPEKHPKTFRKTFSKINGIETNVILSKIKMQRHKNVEKTFFEPQ